MTANWKNVLDNPPPENTPVLGYTDEGFFKVVRLYHGRFDTYATVIAWDELPKNKPNIKPPSKRGRKKKEE